MNNNPCKGLRNRGKLKAANSLLILTLVMTMFISVNTDSYGGTYSGKYWLKVNTTCNVVTVYKKSDGEWKPIRAMVCSTGKKNTTPLGTFYLKGRWQWGALVAGVYGQYCTHITSDILFHSVPYNKRYDHHSQKTTEYNKLGTSASHGCVRLSTMDARWVYNRCLRGTKVTIYKSTNPGPLGKPQAIKVNTKRTTYWDPTDPDPNNPYFKMAKPVITLSSSKYLYVQKGSAYSLTNKVYAKDPNSFTSLSKSIEVYRVNRYSPSKKCYVKSTFSTKYAAIYKVTYRVKYYYGSTAYKTAKIHVIDDINPPEISGATDKSVSLGYINAVKGVTAQQPTVSRTSSIVCDIMKPGEEQYTRYSYNEAKAFVFDTEGIYKIRYTVTNLYRPSVLTSTDIQIQCLQPPVSE